MILLRYISKFYVLLYVIFNLNSIVCGKEHFRCCQINSKLQITRIGNKVNYHCKPIEILYNNATELNVINSDDNLLKFQSFSYKEDEYEHFPNCDSDKMFHKKIKGESISVPGENCVDLVDNSYHVVFCKNYFDTRVEIIQFRKCCPKYYIYDIIKRECVENFNISQYFHRLIEKELNVFSTGPPVCELSKDDVIVEYKSNLHGLSFDKMRLKINGNTPYGGLNSFCIERTLDNIWIAQVCERHSICKKIPCVRKCCNFGEMLHKRNPSEGAVCVADTRMFSPEFYDLDQVKGNSEEATEKEDVEGMYL